VLEYPHADVFKFWAKPISDFHDPVLHDGVAYNEMVIRREIGKPVLERIFYITPFVKDFGVPAICLFVARDHPAHKGKHIGIAGKDDVGTTGVKREPLLLVRTAQSAIVPLCFEHNDIFAFFMQEPGKRQPREPAAKNCGCHW
jgi:hypothetical protein